MKVRAKKHLGQHFLRDKDACSNIALALSGIGYKNILEIGPGMGALTTELLKRTEFTTHVIDIDSESIEWLKSHIPELESRIICGDFLQFDWDQITTEPLAIAGNFPYNISSQILFKILDYKEKCPEMVGMFQYEVAKRICSCPGSKEYGILSVLLQTWYQCTYLFTLPPEAFSPPPKVKSGVIQIIRKDVAPEISDPIFYKKVIKTAFNQRRKTLRNSLNSIGTVPELYSGKRPEQLSFEEFIHLTKHLAQNQL